MLVLGARLLRAYFYMQDPGRSLDEVVERLERRVERQEVVAALLQHDDRPPRRGQDLGRRGAARLAVAGDDPALLASQDPDKVARANRARSQAYVPALDKFRSRLEKTRYRILSGAVRVPAS